MSLKELLLLRILTIPTDSVKGKIWLTVCPDIQLIGAARNGDEALAILQRKKPDIITMDINMPGINGKRGLAYVIHTYNHFYGKGGTFMSYAATSPDTAVLTERASCERILKAL